MAKNPRVFKKALQGGVSKRVLAFAVCVLLAGAACSVAYLADATGMLKNQLSHVAFTVHYEGNAPAKTETRTTAPVASEVPGDQEKYEGVDLELSGQIPVCSESYEFEGWNTQPDGTGDSYQPSTLYTIDADLTLYAQWKDVAIYTVTYDANGGQGLIDEQTFMAGGSTTIADGTGFSFKDCVQEGWDAPGSGLIWNTQPDGSGVSYSAGDTYATEADLVLYAQWARYDLTLESQDYYGMYDAFAHTGEVYLQAASRTNLTTGDEQDLLEKLTGRQTQSATGEYALLCGSAADNCTVYLDDRLLDAHNADSDLFEGVATSWTNVCEGNTVSYEIAFYDDAWGMRFKANSNNVLTGSYQVTITAGPFMRLAGADRVSTAEQINTQIAQNQTGGTMFVVSGTSYLDALAAEPLASNIYTKVGESYVSSSLNYALEVTNESYIANPGSIGDGLELALQSLRPSRVVVVGGTANIEDAQITTIKKVLDAAGVSGYSVMRVSGESRTSTAAAVYALGAGVASKSYYSGSNWYSKDGSKFKALTRDSSGSNSVWGSTLLAANGSAEWGDIYTLVTAARALSAPLLLADSDGSMSSTIAALKSTGLIAEDGKLLTALQFGEVQVMGSQSEVAANGYQPLMASSSSTKRYDKGNVYSNNLAFAKQMVADGTMNVTSIGICTGENYADALCGGNLCSQKESVVLMVPTLQAGGIDTASTYWSAANTWLTSVSSKICRGYIFGGVSRLSFTDERSLNKMINSDTFVFEADDGATELNRFKYNYEGYIQSNLNHYPASSSFVTCKVTIYKDATSVADALQANLHLIGYSDVAAGDYAAVSTTKAFSKSGVIWSTQGVGGATNSPYEQVLSTTIAPGSESTTLYLRYWRTSNGANEGLYNDSLQFRVSYGEL